MYSRVYAKIDLDAVAWNMEQMKKNLAPGTRMTAVVKTDGYGHGAVPIAKEIEAYDYLWGFATATLEEALILRRNGIEKPILILGYTFPEQYEALVAADLRPVVFREDMAELLSQEAVRQGRTVHIHIKIDTGMSRLGFADNEESVPAICRIGRLPGVEMEGIFSHFVKADEADKTFTYRQISRFEHMLELLRREGVNFPLRHCSASAGLIDVKEADFDMVRAGISIYGLYPSKDVLKERVPLKPVLELKSRVVFVKYIDDGDSVSYGATFTASRRMRIATIPVGYGDGYPRSLSGKGYVLIRGKKAPILGRICMDQFMVDVSDIPGVCEDDEVTLVGRDKDEWLPVEVLSELSGRFNYEFVCDLGKRIPRVFVKNGTVTATQDCFS